MGHCRCSIRRLLGLWSPIFDSKMNINHGPGHRGYQRPERSCKLNSEADASATKMGAAILAVTRTHLLVFDTYTRGRKVQHLRYGQAPRITGRPPPPLGDSSRTLLSPQRMLSHLHAYRVLKPPFQSGLFSQWYFGMSILASMKSSKASAGRSVRSTTKSGFRRLRRTFRPCSDTRK